MAETTTIKTPKRFYQYNLIKDNSGWKDNNNSDRGYINVYNNILEQSITVLGIQALPGTQFIINKGPMKTEIGSTGIFTIEVNDETPIYDLRFTKVGKNTKILIDVIEGMGRS